MNEELEKEIVERVTNTLCIGALTVLGVACGGVVSLILILIGTLLVQKILVLWGF